jgi:2-dehydro-3-deoxygluconokinase
VNIGGAESNVVAALARLGRRTAWVSALPATPLGRRVVEPIRATGVETDGVLWREFGRVGTYFVEFGGSPRGVEVFYDRAGACVAELQPEEIPWELLLDTRLVHLCGILPALSPSCRTVTEEVVRRARKAGILRMTNSLFQCAPHVPC